MPSLIAKVNSDATLTHILSLSDHTGPVSAVDWVPGRRSYSTCITGSVDGTVRVVNLLKNLDWCKVTFCEVNENLRVVIIYRFAVIYYIILLYFF